MSATTVDVPVDQRLCVALYQASHAMDAAYRPLLRRHGLTYPQYTVLCVLQQDGASSVSAVGRRLGLTSSTLSPLLRRLEQQGLVSRRRSAADERSVEVELTTAGRDLGAATSDVQRRVTAATGLGEDEQLRLVETLRRLAGDLRGSGAADGADG